MKAFTIETGVVMALDRSNVDTDQIIAKQYLKSIKRSGFGPHLFDNWRYLDPGAPHIDNSTRRANPEFELNHARYQGASILLARENFGCGSSREHAVWALDDHGFRAVIAPSFGDIFYNNCFKSGLLPIRLPEHVIDALFVEVFDNEGYTLVIDLHQQHVRTPGGDIHEFEIDEFRRECLLNGYDEIELTLQHAADIRAYEERRRAQHPWLFQQP